MIWNVPKEKMKKTMICLILDRSGSMGGKEEDVIGGVNNFLAKQKELPDPAIISMVKFDSYNGKPDIEIFRKMQSLSDIRDITKEDYQPRGATPLLDAIGQTLVQLDSDWAEHQPDRAICVIVTDGMENDSKEYKKEQIKQMIEERQASDKWSFIYLGADVNSFTEARDMGIWLQNTARYKKYGTGVKAMSEAVYYMRSNDVLCAQNLGGELDEDGNIQKQGE